MFIPHSILKRLLLAMLVLVTLAVTGCQSLDFYDQTMKEPVPLPMEPPREKSLISLPAYRIAPPDVVLIEMLKLVPLPPYRVEVYDVLQIQVVGTLLEQPIDDLYLVEAEGSVDLGAVYGKVRVVGNTVEEAEKVITDHLLKFLRSPEVSVELSQSSGTQPVTGQYLVNPDGTINLRQYGMIQVSGLTIAEAKHRLERHLAQFFDSPDVSVEVVGYNSKVYYVITQGAGMGDNILRVPVTGKETVLDAISQVGGLSQVSSKKVWIARPAPAGFGCEQILPVDFVGITKGGSSATNYQVLPGDRVFIAQDSIIAATTFINKATSPLQRLLGVTSLGTATIRNMQRLGRSSQRISGF
jgi:polysaccharide export outer membrane protein